MRLIGKTAAVYGLKGTGKSNFVQYLMDGVPTYSGHLVYDVCREHDTLNRYLPEYRRGDEAEAELNGVVERFVTDNGRDWRPDVFVLEEASRFSGSSSEPPREVYELLDMARHYKTGLLSVARRPAQVHTDFTELADHLFIFRLTGKNDYRHLERTVGGLGDAVRDLDDYHFVHVRPDRSFSVRPPVPEMDTTGRL